MGLDDKSQGKRAKGKMWTLLRPIIAWTKERSDQSFAMIEDYIYKIRVRKRPRRFTRGSILGARYHQRRRMRTVIQALVCFNALAMMANGANLEARQSHFDTDAKPVGIDNRASACMSDNRSLFTGPLIDVNRRVKGVGGALIGGVKMGTMKLSWLDDNGCGHTFEIPRSYFVPQLGTTLLSPQHWAQQMKDNKPAPRGTWCTTYGDAVILHWNQGEYSLTLPLDTKGTNVATLYTSPGYKAFHAFCVEAGRTEPDEQDTMAFDAAAVSDDEQSVTEEPSHDDPMEIERNFARSNDMEMSDSDMRQTPLTTEFDLQGPEEDGLPTIIIDEEDGRPQDVPADFLRWHQKLGHASPRKMQHMARLGLIPKRFKKCQMPVCTSCMYGKATKRPWRTKTPTNLYDPKDSVTAPGHCVSVDQLESRVPGLIAQLRGKPTFERYRYATVFVDHWSRLSYCHLQRTNTAQETIKAKQAFEAYAATHGVNILHYHADNGIFADNDFQNEVRRQGQRLTFCGVNAHFQNGIAERRIRELQDRARTMLIHANRRWPQAVNAYLWPYALRMANDLINETPGALREHDVDRAPIEIFSGTRIAPNQKHWQTFGCPVYVLNDPQASGSGKGPKWTERSRLGIYLGRSPKHARTVPLVLNTRTGLTSPQFHIRMDPSFQTMRESFGGQPPKVEWMTKCGFHRPAAKPTRRQAPEGAKLSRTQRQPKAGDINIDAPRAKRPRNQARDSDAPREYGPEPGSPELSDQPMIEDAQPKAGQVDSTMEGDAIPESDQLREQSQVRFHQPGGDSQRPTESPDETRPGASHRSVQHTPLRHSQRTHNPVHRLIEVMEAEIYCMDSEIQVQDDQKLEDPLWAMKATADPDTMYLHEARRQPDWKQFQEAMEKEMRAHMENKHFSIVKRSSVPEGTPVMPAVWALRRKRRIDTRKVYKHKARINLDGSRQIKGLNYWETYSPVATWASIRLILIMAITNNWQTRQIDFVQAYTQANVECDNLYMEIPKGFELNGTNTKDYVLKVEKNIYGQKQAGRVWNNHLVQQLKKIGFEPSKADPCVFTRGRCIYVLYTDDSILCGPTTKEVDQVIEDMKNVKLDITVEGDISDFLGVKIDRRQDGSIALTQPHIIDQILKDLRLDEPNVATKATPAASSTILRKFEMSDDFDGHFDYRSVIGKLNYLEKCTRPDVSYAVHACARFQSCPKQQHGKAVKWLGRYLLGTRDKGLIFRPDPKLSFECYCDADFAGGWNREEAPNDPSTAKSRSGYVIMYANCPLVWGSKLQTEIALSTCEAELISMSTTLRECIPLMQLLREMQERGFDVPEWQPQVHCKVFEDNSGALEIAKEFKMRPRTKHLNCKYHHFRHYVDKGYISLHAIGTKEQAADIFTKPLSQNAFERHRQFIMNWDNTVT